MLGSAYISSYPDDHPSELTAYTGPYPDSYLLGSLLKDGGSPTLAARSQPVLGPTLRPFE